MARIHHVACTLTFLYNYAYAPRLAYGAAITGPFIYCSQCSSRLWVWGKTHAGVLARSTTTVTAVALTTSTGPAAAQ